MKSLRSLDRRIGFSLGAVGILLGMVAPAVLPAFASADQVTNRSVTMSTSQNGATGVKYKIQFTPTTTGSTEYVTLLFCDSSSGSIVGSSCTGPTGLSVTSATVDAASSGSAAKDQTTNANTYVVGMTLGSGNNTIVLDNVTNPSTANQTFFLRIETFTGAGNKAAAEAAETATTTTGITDFGGVALSTTSNIGVTAYVEESMTFCVSGSAPTAGCASSVTSPSVQLGSTVGTQTVLGNTLSTATDYAQISTNAVSGAVVNLKSDATGCGGLYLSFQSSTCGIKPQTGTSSTVNNGDGKFGLTVGSQAAASGGTATGTLEAATGSHYSSSNYFIDYQAGDTAGVTGPYGSALLDTNSAPISNENIPVTFGADTSATTPAGSYVANLSMIAVGTF